MFYRQPYYLLGPGLELRKALGQGALLSHKECFLTMSSSMSVSRVFSQPPIAVRAAGRLSPASQPSFGTFGPGLISQSSQWHGDYGPAFPAPNAPHGQTATLKSLLNQMRGWQDKAKANTIQNDEKLQLARLEAELTRSVVEGLAHNGVIPNHCLGPDPKLNTPRTLSRLFEALHQGRYMVEANTMLGSAVGLMMAYPDSYMEPSKP